MSDSRIDRRRHSYHFPHSPSDSPHRHEPIAGPSRAPNAGKTPSIILSAPAAEASIPVNEDHIDHSRSEIGTPLQRTPSQVTQKSYDHTDDPYLQEPDPHHDERATQIDRQKGTWDVLALVLNKMIGTGIFTVPGLVLALTQSTRVSVGLWVAGGLYTAACLLLYLEYGTRFPYNGGELIYLDRVYRSWGFYAAIFFTTYHFCFGETAGNAIAFAEYVVISAYDVDEDGGHVDSRVVKLVAVCAISAVCVVLFSLPRFGMFLNKMLAIFKVVLLLAVFSKGMEFANRTDNAFSNDSHSGTSSFIDNMSAFVYVIYSYTGWENANYVAGEIRNLSESRPNSKLLWGSMGAVVLSTVLYVLVVVAYYVSCSYNSIVNAWPALGMGSDFGPKAFGNHGHTLNYMVAVSAFGNLVAVVYTSARIKQAIARQRFVPLWNLLEKDADVPRGGLVLHWLTTMIWIICIPLDKDGYQFAIGISTYGRVVIETVLFLGILKNFVRRDWPFQILRHLTLKVGLPLVLIAFNGIVLVVAAMEDEAGHAGRIPDIIPRYWWSAVVGMLVIFSLLYFSVIWILKTETRHTFKLFRRENRSASNGPIPLQEAGASTEILNRMDGYATNRSPVSKVGHFFGVDITIWEWTADRNRQRWPPTLAREMENSYAEGSQRRMDTRFVGRFPQWVQGVFSNVDKWIQRYLC